MTLTEHQRRMFEQARNPRTDDPLVGRKVRWLGHRDDHPAFERIPVGAVGTVHSWQVANGSERMFRVDFDFDDSGVAYYATLPDPAIELV